MKFTIGFEKQDMQKVHAYWDEIFSNHQWSEGKFVKMFEEKWATYNALGAVAFSSWGGSALAALEYFDLGGKTVLCPSNTFMATPLSILKTGGTVEFVDCNKEDLCMSYDDLVEKIELYSPAGVFVVHIGGHIAFDIERIAALCREKKIYLIEDCAHAHGAEWKGKKPGMWGDAGLYSFYATKTISTGEGGMLVSKHPDIIMFAQQYRNYGKYAYQVEGLNYRMNEFTAALGCVQTDRLDDIVLWKQEYARTNLDPQHANRVIFPPGMSSGYYKYIVFDEIDNSVGKVYDILCHTLMKKNYSLPHSEWIANNHWCVPLYYKGK